MYIKSGNNVYYGTVQTFICQSGAKGVRVKGADIPILEGFKVYLDNDKELSDFSDYTTLYLEKEGANEYSSDGSTVVSPTGGTDPIPPTPYEQLSSRISSVSSRVTEITPYTESKTAYIGDTECAFDKRDGAINVNVVSDGKEVPCTFEVTDKIYVRFEALEEVATVNIVIQ